jgi:hypothetical protein
LCLVSLLVTAVRAEEPNVPGSVHELWADHHPRQEPLDAEIVREWEQELGWSAARVSETEVVILHR